MILYLIHNIPYFYQWIRVSCPSYGASRRTGQTWRMKSWAERYAITIAWTLLRRCPDAGSLTGTYHNAQSVGRISPASELWLCYYFHTCGMSLIDLTPPYANFSSMITGVVNGPILSSSIGAKSLTVLCKLLSRWLAIQLRKKDWHSFHLGGWLLSDELGMTDLVATLILAIAELVNIGSVISLARIFYFPMNQLT